MIWAALLSLGARLKALPEWVWYVAGVIALIVGVIVWDRFDDRAAVEADRAETQARSMDARDRSAEERAQDAVNDLLAEQERQSAINRAAASETAKPPAARATVSPQDRALACIDLRNAGMTNGPKYREYCQ